MRRLLATAAASSRVLLQGGATQRRFIRLPSFCSPHGGKEVSEVPHPFLQELLNRKATEGFLSATEKAAIHAELGLPPPPSPEAPEEEVQQQSANYRRQGFSVQIHAEGDKTPAKFDVPENMVSGPFAVNVCKMVDKVLRHEGAVHMLSGFHVGVEAARDKVLATEFIKLLNEHGSKLKSFDLVAWEESALPILQCVQKKCTNLQKLKIHVSAKTPILVVEQLGNILSQLQPVEGIVEFHCNQHVASMLLAVCAGGEGTLKAKGIRFFTAKGQDTPLLGEDVTIDRAVENILGGTPKVVESPGLDDYDLIVKDGDEDEEA